MSDFRSNLLSFQAATGLSNESQKKTSTESAQIITKMSLKQRLDHLWKTTQLQLSMKHGRRKRPAPSDTCYDQPVIIAVCATIVSHLPHESLWRHWMGESDKYVKDNKNTRAFMLIHAKTPSAVPDNSWTKSHLIPVSHDPDWNDIRVVQAMLSLAEHALLTDATHILFVTESCIPISTLEELAKEIRYQGVTKSFINAYGEESLRCTRFDEHACFNIPDVPRNSIRKHLPGWCLLSRKHIEAILNISERHLGGEELYPLFSKVWAPEEVFFPTALNLLGLLDIEEVICRSIMYAKWDSNSTGRERAHPLVYDGRFGNELVSSARKEGCFFMRKFKKEIRIDDWVRAVSLNENRMAGNGRKC